MLSKQEERHKQELKSGIEETADRHREERAALDKRKREHDNRLEQIIARARETSVIPDENFAPAHTREEIDQWAEKAREYQERRQEQESRGLVAPYLIEPNKQWDLTRGANLLERHEAERQQLADTIRNAYETGRIPGHEERSPERGPSMEL
jgi:hypothetical protein